MVAKVGDDVNLRCVGTDGLVWTKYTGGDKPWQDIVNMGMVGNASKYAVNTDPTNNYELTIKSVILNDARRYQCRTLFKIDEFANAELIVFGNSLSACVYLYKFLLYSWQP